MSDLVSVDHSLVLQSEQDFLTRITQLIAQGNAHNAPRGGMMQPAPETTVGVGVNPLELLFEQAKWAAYVTRLEQFHRDCTDILAQPEGLFLLSFTHSPLIAAETAALVETRASHGPVETPEDANRNGATAGGILALTNLKELLSAADELLSRRHIATVTPQA